jgi:lysophospholipase L1-like esterase
MRYVALGDSYTIGTGVQPAERWPEQLAARRGAREFVVSPPLNGGTSADVIGRQLPILRAAGAEIASLLIGVNDVVQGVPESTYAANVATILDDLRGGERPLRVFAVATPDYTVTPAGADYGDPASRSAAIERFNAVMQAACSQRDVPFVAGTHGISRAAAGTDSMIAADGLHPSAAQYARWVELISPVVERLLAG